VSRDIHVNTVAQLEADQLHPVMLLQAEFPSGTVYFWTGIGTLTYDGNDYTGAGNLISVSSIEETMGIEAKGAVFTLSGLNSSIISLALSEEYQNQPITAWMATLNSSGALINDPFIVFKGKMDVLQIDESGETATLSMQCENRLIDLNRAKVRRYTPEDQNVLYPSDRGLDFVASLQEKEIAWGRAPTS
jgi:hypothetical protein